jgi:hypothetical protein
VVDTSRPSLSDSFLCREIQVPACLPNLLQRVLPSVVSVIAAPANHPEMLLERSLDLLPVLLKPATAEHARAVHAATYTYVLALGHASDDNGTVQSVATVLRMFVSKGGEALLTWGPHTTPQDNLQVQALHADASAHAHLVTTRPRWKL